MTRLTTLAAALMILLTSVVSASQATSKPPAKMSALMTAIQGTWQMTVQNGQDITSGGPMITITIKDNTYVQTVDGTVVQRGTFKIDESKKPHLLDTYITEGENSGQTQLGLIQVEGKTMTGKLAEPGSTARPADLAISEGSFTFTMVKKS